MYPSGSAEIEALLSIVPLAIFQSVQAESILLAFFIVLLLILSFLIMGGEHALFSLTPSEIEELEKKRRTFSHIQHLIARPRRLLVLVKMMQMAINVTVLFLAVKIGVIVFGESSLSWIGYMLEIIVLIWLLLVFQEIIPKFFGGRNNLLWARIMGTPFFLLSQVLFPFTEFIIASSYFIEKRFAREREAAQEGVMEKQEEQLVEESSGESEVPILRGILKFRTIVVRQIMKSRIDMFAVDEKTPFNQLLKTIRETRFSRLPVYRDNLDYIIGILYTKDLLSMLEANPGDGWQRLIREAFFVPEGKKISELLVELQRAQQHIAIVIDEYGRTAGLVTLEDIVEEIIGEIRDETDETIELEYTQIDNDTFIFEGKTPINDFCKVLGISEDFFDQVKSESDSLGGLILEIRGTIPRPQETIDYENLLFTILSVENYRIGKVQVKMQQNHTAAEAT